ncbi:hypothetical protein N9Y92_01415, partial [Chlamydiales bacterium]|nr:hypothetical protein [Chlamydiales bacterium]
MSRLVFIKNRRLESTEDGQISLISQENIQPKGIKEYGAFLGWFLSIFNISFKSFDTHGNLVYLNRNDFCRWLLSIKKRGYIPNYIHNKEEVQTYDTSNIAIPSPFTPAKKLKNRLFYPKNELTSVIDLFQNKIKAIKQAEGNHPIHLIALYEVMCDELTKEIEQVEETYFPE